MTKQKGCVQSDGGLGDTDFKLGSKGMAWPLMGAHTCNLSTWKTETGGLP